MNTRFADCQFEVIILNLSKNVPTLRYLGKNSGKKTRMKRVSYFLSNLFSGLKSLSLYFWLHPIYKVKSKSKNVIKFINNLIHCKKVTANSFKFCCNFSKFWSKIYINFEKKIFIFENYLKISKKRNFFTFFFVEYFEVKFLWFHLKKSWIKKKKW